MATTLSSTRFNSIFSLSIFLLLISTVPAYEFRVGGPRGWTVPTGNESGIYNHWAMRNRFHIGDSLYFKYENDSVLVVDRRDYSHCNTSDPLLEFNDGGTAFRFDRYGFFYFISGEPGHCEAGERMIVRVMVHPEVINPGPGLAPSPQPGDDQGSGSGGSGSGSGSQRSPGSKDASFKTPAKYSAIMAALGVASVILLFA